MALVEEFGFEIPDNEAHIIMQEWFLITFVKQSMSIVNYSTQENFHDIIIII